MRIRWLGLQTCTCTSWHNYHTYVRMYSCAPNSPTWPPHVEDWRSLKLTTNIVEALCPNKVMNNVLIFHIQAFQQATHAEQALTRELFVDGSLWALWDMWWMWTMCSMCSMFKSWLTITALWSVQAIIAHLREQQLNAAMVHTHTHTLTLSLVDSTGGWKPCQNRRLLDDPNKRRQSSTRIFSQIWL